MRFRLLSVLLIAQITFSQTKIMPWGDSICEGNWIGGWRPQLFKMLNDSSYTNWDYVGRKDRSTNPGNNVEADLGFSWPAEYTDYEGYNGRTAVTWRTDMGTAMAAGVPDILVGAIGTNDATNGTYTSTQIRDNIKAVLDTVFARKPNTRVVLGNITKTWASQVGANTLINAVNALLPAMVNAYVADGKYIVLVDQNSALSLSTDFEDYAHPSVTGYPKMARAYYPAVVAALTYKPKFFVYVPTWGLYVMPPSDLKFPTGVQMYYMHFSAHASTTSPYFSVVVGGNTDSADLHYLQQALIDTAHNNGGKVLLSITAQDNTLGNLTVAQQKVFVSSVCAYLRRKGYDGVDLDWEINLSSAAVGTMIQTFRDTLNARQPTQNILVMSVLTDPFTYTSWNFYNIPAMDQYLDAYFTMSYGMHGVERQADALGGEAGGVWRCMFDAPYVRPVGSPWSGFTGGYWAANFKENSIVKWMARGADTSKIGIGLWNGGTRMLNSSSVSIPGSVISYGTANFPTYPQVLAGTSNYDTETDSWWGIVGGLYTSWIDSAGAYKRTKWAKDTMHTNIFMLYDAYSGFIDGAARYGRQPHFDAMVNAMGTSSAPPTAVVPTVTTTAVSAITGTTATSGGNVTASGGATVTARGVCWSTSANPTTSDPRSSNSTGTGSFTSSLISLSPGTLYYVRAYATNSAGTGYGNQVSFTTLSLGTVAITNVGTPSATRVNITCNVSSDGGSTVTGRGVVYNLTGTPTTSDGVVTASGTTGSYTSQIIYSYAAGTTVYVRAYVQNGAGTAYSSQSTFTIPGPPTVVTLAATSLSKVGAVLNGTINAAGFSTTDTFLVRPADSVSYTRKYVGSPATVTGSTTTAVSVTLTGLTSDCSTLGSEWFYRVQGTNSAATVQGVELSFRTLPAMSSLEEKVDSVLNKLNTIETRDIAEQRRATSDFYAYFENLKTDFNDPVPRTNLSSSALTTLVKSWAGLGTIQLTVSGVNANGTTNLTYQTVKP